MSTDAVNRATREGGRGLLSAVGAAGTRTARAPIAFCARCGARPPGGGTFEGARVCRWCGLGLVLQAPADIAPNPFDAFMVVGRGLRLSALSRRGEALLGVAEENAVGLPVRDLLVPSEDGFEGALSAASASASGAGSGVGSGAGTRWSGRAVAIDPGSGRRTPLRLGVGPCGPPRAALVVAIEIERDGAADE